MKLTLVWNSPIMEWDYMKCKEVPSKFDQEHISLTVGIHNVSEKEAYAFLNKLEEKINEELEDSYGHTEFARCSGYEDTKDNALFDLICWTRDHGNVTEQKKEILQTIRRVYKDLKNQTLKEKRDFTWQQITEKIEQVKKEYDIPFELRQDYIDNYYVADVNGGDNYFRVCPISKIGRKRIGSISYSVFPENSHIFYRTYDEFEKELNNWLSNVL